MTATDSMRVLVVDDEPDAAEALTLLLKPRGFDVRVAGTGDAARSVVTAWRPHVVLLDLMLPDVNGLDLLRDFRAAVPDTQVVMVTGYGSVPKVVEAMNGGAFGFIEKPIDAMLLLAVLDKATEKLALAAENRRLRSELHDHASLDDMVARSDKMKQLFTLVRKVAPSDASVLIVGENGTGKELVASALHQNSKRAKGPFIKINCAAIPVRVHRVGALRSQARVVHRRAGRSARRHRAGRRRVAAARRDRRDAGGAAGQAAARAAGARVHARSAARGRSSRTSA